MLHPQSYPENTLHKDVNRRTIEIPQRTCTFKVSHCLKVHNASGGSRISPRGGGAPTPKIAIIFHIFAENCMKMKEFGPPGGGARPWRPPLGSANECTRKVTIANFGISCSLIWSLSWNPIIDILSASAKFVRGEYCGNIQLFDILQCLWRVKTQVAKFKIVRLYTILV